MRLHKTPIRTCVSCRTSGEKMGLVRIIRNAAGEVVVDATGKMPGRGAYICPSQECFRRAIKEKRLSRALRTEVPEDAINKIQKTIEQGSPEM